MKHPTLFSECDPGANGCPKQMDLEDLLRRFAAYALVKQAFMTLSCPGSRYCKSDSKQQRWCQDYKRREDPKRMRKKFECWVECIRSGGDIDGLTEYQRELAAIVLDGKERAR